MKKNILLLLMSCLFFITSDAQAQECDDTNCCAYEESNYAFNKANVYAKVLGGANFLQNTPRTGYIISGSLGVYLPYGFRVEAEYAFRKNPLKETLTYSPA